MGITRAASVAEESERATETMTTPSGGSAVVVTPAVARSQRRPLLLVVSVLLIVLGAAGGALAWFSIGTAVDAVVARATIGRGQVMAVDDFVVVQVNPDPHLQFLVPDDISSLVGERAAHDVAAGGLVPASVVQGGVLPSAGQSVIGLSLGPGFHPGVDLKVGDHVRIVLVEPVYACGTAAEAADGVGECRDGRLTVPGSVVSVSRDPASSQLFLGVQVDEGSAALAASASSMGKAAVVLDTRER
ncbi:hypothetical protein GCM10028820_31630 [Tessaracoccus terricola]